MYAVGEFVVPIDLLGAFHNPFNQSFRSGSTKGRCRGGHCESVTSFCRLPKVFPDGDQPLGLKSPKELESKVFGKPEDLGDGPGSNDETGGLTHEAANVPRWKPGNELTFFDSHNTFIVIGSHALRSSYISASLSSAGVPRALSGESSALIDELLYIRWVEPQRASAWTHLDGRKVWLSLAGRMLHDP